MEKSSKTKVLFSQRDVDFETAKTEYCNLHEINAEEVSDEAVYSFIQSCIEQDWFDFETNIKSLNRQNVKYLIIADLGLWNGRQKGGSFITGLWNAITSGLYDNIKITDTDGKLQIETTHHDGANYYTIYELTKKGYDYANARNFIHDRKLHEHLIEKKGYVKNVNLYKKIFG